MRILLPSRKIVRKTLIPTVLGLLLDFLSFVIDPEHCSQETGINFGKKNNNKFAKLIIAAPIRLPHLVFPAVSWASLAGPIWEGAHHYCVTLTRQLLSSPRSPAHSGPVQTAQNICDHTSSLSDPLCFPDPDLDPSCGSRLRAFSLLKPDKFTGDKVFQIL
jgi:hypothetical protein